MIRKMTLAALVAVLVAPSGASAEDKPPAAPFDDGAFITTAAIGGAYDLHLSYLVGPLCKNGDVRTFAAGVAADRISASAGLKAAAKDAGIELPTKLDEVHQKRYEGFKDYKGDDLARDFVTAMVQRHTDGVALFTRASKEAKNPAVKEFAAQTLPALQKRLEMAKGLDK